MPRIMCIDFGLKRCGISVTDPLKIIATGLGTYQTHTLIEFLVKYFTLETVELVLIGLPVNMNGSDTHATQPVKNFIIEFEKKFSTIKIKTIDERFSSKLAKQAILQMGIKKEKRKNKSLVDVVAATMLLQEYLIQN